MERHLEIDEWAGSLLVNGLSLLARTHLKVVGEDFMVFQIEVA